MIRIIGSDTGWIPGIRVLGLAPVAGGPLRVPATGWPGFRDGLTGLFQGVAVPLASKRARLVPHRDPPFRKPFLRIAADYSVSVPPLGRDEWGAVSWQRHGKDRPRSSGGTRRTIDRIWVT